MDSHHLPASASAALTAGLERLVVKDGVALGGLPEATRMLVLGFVWAGLARRVFTEREVNDALKQQLATAARCLDIDHVELRRWLCDAGWVQRDAWGREYRRCETAALPEGRRAQGEALAAAFPDGDTAGWVDRLRAARAAERQARRRAFEGAAPPAAP